MVKSKAGAAAADGGGKAGKPAPAPQKQEQAPKGKRAKDEIDEIFGSKPAAKKAATGGAGAGDGGGTGDAGGGGAASTSGSGGAGGGSAEQGAALRELEAKVKAARQQQQVRRGQRGACAAAAPLDAAPRSTAPAFHPLDPVYPSPFPPSSPQGTKEKVTGSKDDIFGEASGKARKRTEEGYRVYTEDELGFGRKGGGDTDLCPFDCDCCF